MDELPLVRMDPLQSAATIPTHVCALCWTLLQNPSVAAKKIT